MNTKRIPNHEAAEGGHREVEQWERQPWETGAAFRAFGYYLEALSVDGAYKRYLAAKNDGEDDASGDTTEHNDRKKPRKAARAPKSWRNWSHGLTSTGKAIPGAKSWDERAKAWEDHVWEERRREWMEAEFDWAKKAMEKAKKLLERDLPDELPPAAAARLADTASKLARLSAGEPTDRHDVTSGGERIENVDAYIERILAAIASERGG